MTNEAISDADMHGDNKSLHSADTEYTQQRRDTIVVSGWRMLAELRSKGNHASKIYNDKTIIIIYRYLRKISNILNHR